MLIFKQLRIYQKVRLNTRVLTNLVGEYLAIVIPPSFTIAQKGNPHMPEDFLSFNTCSQPLLLVSGLHFLDDRRVVFLPPRLTRLCQGLHPQVQLVGRLFLGHQSTPRLVGFLNRHKFCSYCPLI